MEYKWNCSNSLCNKEVIYDTYKKFWQAKKRNSVCKSCRTVIGNTSVNRDSKSREKNSQWKGYKEIPYGWFSRYFERRNKNRTRKNGTITIENVHDLWIKQNKKCALTGLPIGFYDDGKTHTCSIDRVDSLKEYDLDNIQLVHKDINLMKNRFTHCYFIEMCRLVSENGICEVAA